MWMIRIPYHSFVIGDTICRKKVPFDSKDLVECECREFQPESMPVLINLIEVMKDLKRQGVFFEASDSLKAFPDPSLLGTARQPLVRMTVCFLGKWVAGVSGFVIC